MAREAGRIRGLKKPPLLVLLACLFVVMIGFGITLPVLPFYVERLASADGGSHQRIVLHLTLLTGVYALMQLISAPFWGHWSDRIGRRPLILIGISGYVVAQVMFGISTTLWLLYLARIVGGVLSSATLPASTAYVADTTGREDRARGMAWLGTAASLGVVVGPALGGLLSQRALHVRWSSSHLRIDSFSVPFFAAAVLGLVILFAAFLWLPESRESFSRQKGIRAMAARETKTDWRLLLRTLSPLLVLTLVSQFALAVFEGTFALFAQTRFSFGPAEVGYVFVVCGLVMTIFQAGAVGILAGKISEWILIGAGFTLMGAGVTLLGLNESTVLIFVFVAVLSLGMAFIAPNLNALVSKRVGERSVGVSLGIQNAANSLGQSLGPFLGGALLLWKASAPYLFSGALLLTAALAVGLMAYRARKARAFPGTAISRQDEGFPDRT